MVRQAVALEVYCFLGKWSDRQSVIGYSFCCELRHLHPDPLSLVPQSSNAAGPIQCAFQTTSRRGASATAAETCELRRVQVPRGPL